MLTLPELCEETADLAETLLSRLDVRSLAVLRATCSALRAGAPAACVLTVACSADQGSHCCVCSVVDRQPEPVWAAAAAGDHPAGHPLRQAPCVRAWLARRHRLAANMRRQRCRGATVETAGGCTVEHDSRLLHCWVQAEAAGQAALHVCELLGEPAHRWPLPGGRSYHMPLLPQHWSTTTGRLAVSFSGHRQQGEGHEGFVVVDVTSGACTVVCLPNTVDGSLGVVSWGSGPTPCVFTHTHDRASCHSAYSADGVLVGSVTILDGPEGELATVSAWDPAGNAAAIASCCPTLGLACAWRWQFRTGVLQDFGIRTIQQADKGWPVCSFSPCSELLLRRVGDGLDIVCVHTQAVVQHIPSVPAPGVSCWTHLGATVMIHTSSSLQTCASVQLLRPSGSRLVAADCVAVRGKAFLGEMNAASEDGRHLLLLAGTVSETAGRLSEDLELVILDLKSAEVLVLHSLDFKPAWFDFVLGDSTVVAADETGHRLLVLDFR